MKKEIIVFLLAVALLTASSCKKSSSSSISSTLVGTWKLSKLYADTIGNGNLNTAKLIADTSVQILEFYANGDLSVALNGIADPDTYSWILTYNNSYLKIISGNVILDNNSAVLDSVLTLTSATLVLKDTSGVRLGSGTTWTYYTKQ